MKKAMIACALLALFVSPAALADARLGTSGAGKICVLDPTNAGFAVSAVGQARLLSGAKGEAIAVKVQANLEDTTMLIVSVENKKGEKFDVGAMHLFFGVGVWQWQTWKDGHSKAFPIDGIASISVRHKDSTLLFGLCGATAIKPME